jgi:signal peptidase II
VTSDASSTSESGRAEPPASSSVYGHISALFEKQRMLFWMVAAVLFALDQTTKLLYASTLGSRAEQVQIIPGVLKFVDKLPNQQGVFGMGPSSPIFYAIATGLGLLLIGYFVVHLDPTRVWPHIGLGLLCGGALGNLVDRLVFSAVRDFIQMALWPFIYNVADAGICVGVVMLMGEALFGPGPVKEESG